MRWRELVVAACVCAATPVAVQARAPSRPEVQQAAQAVGAHPDLPGKKKVKTLKLRDKETAKKAKEHDVDGWGWGVGLFRWLAETARLLMWVAGAIVVALLLVGLRRWLRVRGPAHRLPDAPPPTHVQSLDIRPESLPEQVGAAAAALWQRGDYVAALSLLYRGALSRLVHGHGVPIKAASTEGECVTLAKARLDAPRGAFVGTLVSAWQLAVYGGRMPDGTQVLALCREFDVHLSPATPVRAA